MATIMRDINLLGHPVIIAAYFALAASSCLIRLGTPRRTSFARAGGAAFFLGCALHHVDMLHHIQSNTPLDGSSFHHTIPTLMQAFGAPIFMVALMPYTKALVAILRQRNAS